MPEKAARVKNKMTTIPHPDSDPYTIARIWTVFSLASLSLFVIVLPPAYFELDALGIWVLTSIGILYLSRKAMDGPFRERPVIIALGAGLMVFSFFSIPLRFTHPPYSIGEYTLLLSGAGLVLFGLCRFRPLIVPVALPSLAVIGFSGYELFLRNQDWITAPLVPVTTAISVSVLNLIGINSVVSDNIFTFVSQTGSPISLSIVSDCSGIMSLGTFTIAAVIVLANFPRSITMTGMAWILIGYAGTYGANILRIVLIALSGYYFGPVGVIEKVHVNIGWIVFSLWMLVFWYYFFSRQVGIPFFGPKKDGQES